MPPYLAPFISPALNALISVIALNVLLQLKTQVVEALAKVEKGALEREAKVREALVIAEQSAREREGRLLEKVEATYRRVDTCNLMMRGRA